MKHLLKGGALVTLLATTTGHAQETLRMATIAPSLGQAITMATFANIVANNLEGVEIEVAAGGAATVHQLEIGRGNLELSMTSPTIYNLMAGGRAMYANQDDAPDASENVQLLMWYPYGQYHFAVRSDSDIELLDDIEGATVFLGPQGGGAYNSARGWIAATTGLVAGEDYEAISANWQTGFQSFLDGSVDLYVNGCIDPCQQFLQITETEDIRFIEPESYEGEEVDSFLGAFRTIEEIPAGLYERQTNEMGTMSFDTSVGIAVRADIDEELVYQITRAFWENIDQVTSDAPWASALNAEYAAVERGLIQLHPGAARYYREIGVLE